MFHCFLNSSKYKSVHLTEWDVVDLIPSTNVCIVALT